MTDRKQKIKNALDALEGALKYAKHHYEYSKEPVTHGDLIAPILTAMNALCDLQNESPRDWTPCAEGLPAVKETVLATIADGFGNDIMFAWYDGENWQDGYKNKIPVIAWKPLPAPYRADDTTGKVKEDAEKESHNPQECKNCDVDRDLHKSYLICTKHHGGIDRDPSICDGCVDFRKR